MTRTNEEKSAIFTAYNLAKKSRRFEYGRLNRALGLVLSTWEMIDKVEQYNTSIKACSCPDSQKECVYACKHRIAIVILRRANQLIEKGGNR